MTEQELQFEPPAPRVRLYAILTDSHLTIMTSSDYARTLGWSVTFTNNQSAALRQRTIIPLPLSTIKKLIRRCKPHQYDGKFYTSWRNHPQGFDGKEETAIKYSDGLLKIIKRDV